MCLRRLKIGDCFRYSIMKDLKIFVCVKCGALLIFDKHLWTIPRCTKCNGGLISAEKKSIIKYGQSNL